MNLQPRAVQIVIMLILAIAGMQAHENNRVFRNINAANGLADNSAQAIVCTKTGRMVVATLGNISFYDGKSFSRVSVRQSNYYQLGNYRGSYRLFFDRRHHLWLKNTHTITCLNLTLEQFSDDVEGVFRALGCEETVRDFFVDSSNGIWLLTDAGLYGVEQQKTYPVLSDHNLQDLDVYDGKQLLLFYENGEEVGLDLDSGVVGHRTKSYEWEESQLYLASSALQPYGDGYFQIRSGEQQSVLLFFNVRQLKWDVVLKLPYRLNGMSLRGDSLYVASDRGYWVYDVLRRRLEHCEELVLTDGKRLSTDINTLTFDKQGGMWIGTEKRGLYYAHPMKSPFHVFACDDPMAMKYVRPMEHQEQNISSYDGKTANCAYSDSRHWMWIGTTSGLYLVKKPDADPILISKKDGLNNEVIHAIIEDRDHRIWVSTSCGISCVFVEDGEVVFVNSFTQNEGVPVESFANCKSAVLPDGTIAMQSIDHVVTFHPDSFGVMNNRKPVKLFPKLVRVMVNGSLVEPGMAENGNMIIDRAATRVREISLNANQNTVSLTFSPLNYFRPLQTYYRVRVKGLDDRWQVLSHYDGDGLVDADGMLRLPLVNLPPGDYDVEVQASTFPGLWDGTPFVWNVHVNQSWWQKSGTLFLLGGFVLGLLILNLALYSRNVKLRSRRNSKEADMIRKIRSYVERVDSFQHEKLAPRREELVGEMAETVSEPSKEFVSLMLLLVPYVRRHLEGELTSSQLCRVAGIDVPTLFGLVSNNLHKSPRTLVRIMRLRKAEELLRSTDMSVEGIAAKSGFHTVNYFIGTFFHEYKMTPREYREEKR